MTAIDDYRRTLVHLVRKYDVSKVLEIGVEKGVSTKTFCDSGCLVVGVDINDTDFKHENFKFMQIDSTGFIAGMDYEYDMIFLDAFYTYERLGDDVPKLWEFLRKGGILVFNEYIDFANHRNGEVRKFVHEWANQNMREFAVYPLRNGFAVFEK